MPKEESAGAMSSLKRWGPVLTYIVLLGLILWLRSVRELALPLGSDAAMWGLSAMGLLGGELPQVAPVFPALVALSSGLSGLPVWRVGSLVSALAAAGLPVLVFVASRDLGAGRWPALAAGALSLLLPDVAVFAFQLQPDALAALLLVTSAWLGMRWERAQSRAALFQWLACLLLLGLTREHGQVLLAGLPVYFLARKKPLWALGFVLVSLFLLAVLVRGGALHVLPERIAQPLLESPLGAGQGSAPHFYSELNSARREGQQLWTQGRVLPVMAFNLKHLLSRHVDNLAILLLGAAGFGALARREGVGAAGLFTLLPALVILLLWSNQRHSAVLLPVGVLGVACGLRALRTWAPSAGPVFILLSLVAVGWSMRDAGPVANRLTGAAHHARQVQTLAGWLADYPGEWMLGGLDNEPNVFLAWPRVALERSECLVEDPGPLWRTLWLAPAGVMPEEWEQLHQQGPTAVYVLRSDAPRPCSEKALPAGPLYTKAGQSAEFSCATPLLSETQRRQRLQGCQSGGPAPGRPPPHSPGGGHRKGPPGPR